jgi:hypothetical protein
MPDVRKLAFKKRFKEVFDMLLQMDCLEQKADTLCTGNATNQRIGGSLQNHHSTISIRRIWEFLPDGIRKDMRLGMDEESEDI